jgi:hypothetical protein
VDDWLIIIFKIKLPCDSKFDIDQKAASGGNRRCRSKFRVEAFGLFTTKSKAASGVACQRLCPVSNRDCVQRMLAQPTNLSIRIQ